jgi:hypothetical protein
MNVVLESTIGAEQAPNEEAGWEWMFLEIMGHRSHWGRARQEERYGAKMLRIDVPKIVAFVRNGDGPGERLDPPRIDWETHFYGGSSIFSITLTDEATVMAQNRPYEPPYRARLPAPEPDDSHDFDGLKGEIDTDEEA